MKHTYTIPTSDITNADVRPLREYIATLSADWLVVFGSLTIDYTIPLSPDGTDVTTRYWRTAIATIPWLPFALAPQQPCVSDLVVAQLPRAIRENAGQDIARLEHHLRAVLRDWNEGIVIIALVAGVEPAQLAAHMDSIASYVLGRLGAHVTLAK